MRWVRRIGIALLALAVLAAGFGFWTVRRSFPQTTGQIEIAGLDGEVEIVRDELGVPHIYASTSHDLFFAQGFVHAQDRFWQMDFWRHIGKARLSEMFGEDQLDADKFLRSLGWSQLADEELANMSPELAGYLQAYADGVNSYVESRSPAALSLEYALLPLLNSGYEIEPWHPTDSLVWAKVMAWDLGGNMRAEIARTLLAKTLPLDRVEQLYPPMPGDRPVIVESQEGDAEAVYPRLPEVARDAVASLSAQVTAIDDTTGGGFEGIGSNNWVISGEHTATGLPLLANDTHLAIQMPSIWYENALHCVTDCDFDLIGFTFAGIPGIVIGHNNHHAWGVTNQAADTQDLFVERVNPEQPDLYEVDGEWIEFETRDELIEVAGGEDVTHEVMVSRHGPVITGTFLDPGSFDGSSTFDDPGEYVVSLSWTALEPSTIFEAFIGIGLAQSYEEFSAAAALWDIAPQNLVYADVEGNIAYHATGRIPVRAGGDGRYPVPGWTGDYDWVDFVESGDKPKLINPNSGFIETANQLVIRPGSVPLIGTDTAHGYRASRIEELILARDDHDVEAMTKMQMDSRDGFAAQVLDHVLALDLGEPEVVDSLQTWATGENAFQARADSTGAAYYMAIWRHILANTFGDELPEEYLPGGGSRWFEVVGQMLEEPEDPYWDDVSTVDIEDRDDILVRSVSDAMEELDELLGGDTPTWGEMHIAEFENQTFGQSGIAPIEWLFNRTAPPAVSGSESVVNAVGWEADVSYRVDWVPSQRMVIDLADFDRSTFVHTTGQSGHAFHRNYDSMIELWAGGVHGPMPWTRPAVDEVAEHVLTLIPAS